MHYPFTTTSYIISCMAVAYNQGGWDLHYNKLPLILSKGTSSFQFDRFTEGTSRYSGTGWYACGF